LTVFFFFKEVLEANLVLDLEGGTMVRGVSLELHDGAL